MRFYSLGKYEGKDRYGFEELPKGEMFALSMNPYTGQVFCRFDKHESSTAIVLELLKRIVTACEVYERFGSKDALQDYAEHAKQVEKLIGIGMMERVIASEDDMQESTSEKERDRKTA